jgi:hypothetical protein
MTLRIVEALNDTGYMPPNTRELAALLKIVLAAHPLLPAGMAHEAFLDEFAHSFDAVGHLYRTDAPNSKRYFSAWIEDTNIWLERQGRAPVSGNAFLAACLAHGDVPWRQANDSVGQLLEVGLHATVGRRCKNCWREILRGERTLLPPTPPDRERVRAVAPSPVKIFQENRFGNMVEFDPTTGKELWSR